MSVCNFKPLDNVTITSGAKLAWRCEQVVCGKHRRTRITIVNLAMCEIRRPTDHATSIADGYVVNKKFHDGEPGIIVDYIDKRWPDFFDSYPRRSTTKLDRKFKCGVIGELARDMYKGGRPSYGKPGLRRTDDTGTTIHESFNC